MSDNISIKQLREHLVELPRFELALLPTPTQRLKNFGTLLGGPALWMKRDDLTGLVGGGNKTRKLEYLVGDAITQGADMLVTVGAIQSNHTRQTAAAAAKSGLKSALLHCAWTKDAGPNYRKVGNILLSHMIGADLYYDKTIRPIEDQGPLEEFITHLRDQGHKPYLIPGGASEHPLGSLGYMNCAIEITQYMITHKIDFNYIIHTTGSSSTQAGLVAGFKALGVETKVVGIADDNETDIKKERVKILANDALNLLGLDIRVDPRDIDVRASNEAAYGLADTQIKEGIKRLAETEGIVADPVYEGRAIRGLLDLAEDGFFPNDANILLMHLGGTPAVHAYAEQFGNINLRSFNTDMGRSL